MTRTEWLSLKPGDIIIENSSGTERRIISVTHTKNPNMVNIRTSITMKKIGFDGWTKGKNTTYNNTDDRGRWRLKG
jgi:hypothetical protein